MELKNLEKTERNLIFRLLSAFGWQQLIHFGLVMLIGGVVGGIAGIGESTPESGGMAGAKAAQEFIAKYGWVEQICSSFLFLTLLFLEKLPGTSKSRNVK